MKKMFVLIMSAVLVMAPVAYQASAAPAQAVVAVAEEKPQGLAAWLDEKEKMLERFRQQAREGSEWLAASSSDFWTMVGDWMAETGETMEEGTDWLRQEMKEFLATAS